MTRTDGMGKKKKSAGRVIAAAGLGLVVAALGYVGWNWLDSLVVERVTVGGQRHAPVGAVLDIVRVDSGVRLLDVDPELIADRAARHPWVRAATVRRVPPGTVAIAIEERVPVVLAITADGRPDAYVDRWGYPMPLVNGAVYDVPLMRGVRLPANRTRPIDMPVLQELLPAVADLNPAVDALVSGIEIDARGNVTLHTTPSGTQQSIDVQLGKRSFVEKFERLEAFWAQAVLSRPDVAFASIDLRFDGQIVTQED